MAVTAITLVCNPADAALDDDVVDEAMHRLFEATDGADVKRRTLEEGVAEDFLAAVSLTRAEAEAALLDLLDPLAVDIIAQPAKIREKRLLIADMDSTIIGQECIDELADFAGLKAEISAITERAMRGELDFEAALTERVAMLRGLPVSALEETFQITLNEGARALIATMKARGAETLLVSGGFTFFVERVARLAGFAEFQANELLIEGGALAGSVRMPILGRAAKEDALKSHAARLGVRLARTLAVGDGANDLAMIAAAGLGVAYRAKPKVAEAADASIRHADLTALLYAQGLTRADFSL
jgi:phosphoserine phosphatase